MTASTIKQKLHSYLEVADEKKLKAIYTLMEVEIENTLLTYSDELKTELDSRYKQYTMGEIKTVTAAESRKRLEKIIKTKHK